MKTDVVLVCKINWKISKPLEMVSIAETSVTMMTSNSAVPIPKVPLGDMTTAATLVRKLYPTRKGTDAQKLAYKNAVEDLDTKLHTQVIYIDEQANGSEVIIVSCGFIAISNERTKAVVCDPVDVVKLTPTRGGILGVVAEMPEGATGLIYVIYTGVVVPLLLVGNVLIVPEGASGIQIVARGKARMKIPGFTNFAKVSLIAYGTNAAGISAPSGIFTTKTL